MRNGEPASQLEVEAIKCEELGVTALMSKTEVLSAVLVDACGSPRSAPSLLGHGRDCGLIVRDSRYENTRFCNAFIKFDCDASFVIAQCKGAEVELKFYCSGMIAYHPSGVLLESVQ